MQEQGLACSLVCIEKLDVEVVFAPRCLALTALSWLEFVWCFVHFVLG